MSFTAYYDGEVIVFVEVVHPYAPGKAIDEEYYCIHHYCPLCSKRLPGKFSLKIKRKKNYRTPRSKIDKSFNKYSQLFEITLYMGKWHISILTAYVLQGPVWPGKLKYLLSI